MQHPRSHSSVLARPLLLPSSLSKSALIGPFLFPPSSSCTHSPALSVGPQSCCCQGSVSIPGDEHFPMRKGLCAHHLCPTCSPCPAQSGPNPGAHCDPNHHMAFSGCLQGSSTCVPPEKLLQIGRRKVAFPLQSWYFSVSPQHSNKPQSSWWLCQYQEITMRVWAEPGWKRHLQVIKGDISVSWCHPDGNTPLLGCPCWGKGSDL